MDERHVPLSTVAGRLGVSERTVRRWIKAGKLRAYRPGRDYRIPESALREFVEESEISPKAQAPPSSQPPLNGFDEGWRLDASFWIECLNAQAELVEHIIALGAGSYDLETIWKLEGAAVELWGTYSLTVKRAVREWCSPGQREQLQQAEARMKEARSAVRQAYQERRDGEQDRQKVVDLDARRQAREDRYPQDVHADIGS